MLKRLKKDKETRPSTKDGKKLKQYYSKEEVHSMMADVAESSANAAVKKVTAAWKKRGREEKHAIENVSTNIKQLNLDRDDESISDDQSI